MHKSTGKKPEIFIISLGCPRNLVDSEILLGKFSQKGFPIIYKPNRNCIALVNTCAFTEEAKSESIDVILELADLKKKGRIKGLIVSGCLSQRYSKELMDEIGEIDAVFGSSTFPEIPKYIEETLMREKRIAIDKAPAFLYNHNMPRFVLTPSHSVYVKIQEGCMNFCSYCVIPRIRGIFRSRSMGSVLKEVSALKKAGAKEINIIGQDTTLYGKDKYGRPELAELLKRMSKIMESGWIRLLYTHPAHYNSRLIDVIKNEAPICKYLDLPIQHINDKILKMMNRHITKKGILTLIERLKKHIPNLALRTSIIVGFPDESEKDFDELKEFIKVTKFDRLGVFIYSREEKTRAFDFPNQIPHREKCRRFDEIMKIQKAVSEEKNRACLGKVIKVLVDEEDPTQQGQYIGRTEHDAPEVDGVVYITSKRRLKAGDFVEVKIEDTLEYDLVGKEISGESTE